MWLVYIIYSKKSDETYVGSTDNFQRRLNQHNNNLVKSTKNKNPWIPIYVEFYPNKFLVRKREYYLKSSSGRRFLKKQVDSIIKKWLGSSVG